MRICYLRILTSVQHFTFSLHKSLFDQSQLFKVPARFTHAQSLRSSWCRTVLRCFRLTLRFITIMKSLCRLEAFLFYPDDVKSQTG